MIFDLGCPGLEPGTNRLKAEYSTIELATPINQWYAILFFFATVFYWGERLDLLSSPPLRREGKGHTFFTRQKSLIYQLKRPIGSIIQDLKRQFLYFLSTLVEKQRQPGHRQPKEKIRR